MALANAAAELLSRTSNPQQQAPIPFSVAADGDTTRTNITVHLPTPRATGTPSTAGGIAFSPESQLQQRQQKLTNLSMNDEAVAPNIAVTAATGVSSDSNHALAEQSFITVEDSLAKYDDALNRTGSVISRPI